MGRRSCDVVDYIGSHLLLPTVSIPSFRVTFDDVMKDKDICCDCGSLTGWFYLHANHIGADQEYTGLIMPNTLVP